MLDYSTFSILPGTINPLKGMLLEGSDGEPVIIDDELYESMIASPDKISAINNTSANSSMHKRPCRFGAQCFSRECPFLHPRVRKSSFTSQDSQDSLQDYPSPTLHSQLTPAQLSQKQGLSARAAVFVSRTSPESGRSTPPNLSHMPAVTLPPSNNHTLFYPPSTSHPSSSLYLGPDATNMYASDQPIWLSASA